jgi:hypothetical protein
VGPVARSDSAIEPGGLYDRCFVVLTGASLESTDLSNVFKFLKADLIGGWVNLDKHLIS